MRGSLASSSFEFAPEASARTSASSAQLAQAYLLPSLAPVVLASAARFGVVSPLGGQELIPSERFFAGGRAPCAASPEDSLATRDFFGEPEGGRHAVVLNQEVRVPIYRWLRGVAFVDAGNVFARAERRCACEIWSARLGVGLRLVDAVRAAARRLREGGVGPDRPERSGRWIFGIGQAF